MTTAKIFGGNLTAGQQNIVIPGTAAQSNAQPSLDLNAIQNSPTWGDAFTNADRIQSPNPSNISNYNANTPYQTNEYAKDPVTNTIYRSVRGDLNNPNQGNSFSDQSWWTVVGNKFFAFEEIENAPIYVLSSLIAEIQRAGLSDWISTTEYYENAIVKEAGTNKIYTSKISNNLGNILTDTNAWTYLNDLNNLIDLETKYAFRVSPALQGTPTAPTPPIGDNSNRIATTEFVNQSLQLNPTDLGAIKMYKYFSNENVPTIKTFSNGAKAYLFNGQTLTQAQAPTLFAERGWGASVVLESRAGRVSIAYGGSYGIGSTGGASRVTLSRSQVPKLTYSVYSSTTFGTLDTTTGVLNGDVRFTGVVVFSSSYQSKNGAGRDIITSNAGGGSHENMQPYIVDAHYLIAW